MKLPPNTAKDLADLGFVGSVKYRGKRFYYRRVQKCLVWKPTMPEQTKGGLR